MQMLTGNVLEKLIFNNVINETTTDLLTMAFKCGLFVAGGFADAVASYRLSLENLKFYTYCRMSMVEYVHACNDMKLNCQRKIQGDIDLWAATTADCDRFLEAAMSHRHVIVERSQANWGYNIFCFKPHADHMQKVQLITEVLMEPDKVSHNFDIVNAMNTIVDDKLYVHDRWWDLRASAELSLVETQMKGAASIRRIAKWKKFPHKYRAIHPDSHHIIDDLVRCIIEKDELNHVVNFENYLKDDVAESAFQHINQYLSWLFPCLRPETLLALSAYDNSCNRVALDALLDRVMVPQGT